MTTDWKALCAELLDWAVLLCEPPEPPVVRSATELSDLIQRARAALAEPEPKGLKADDMSWSTPKTVRAIGMCIEGKYYALDNPEPEKPTVMEIIALADEIEEAGLGQVDLVRAALTRWGRPTPPPALQPVPVLPEGTQVIEPTEHTLLVPVAQPIPVSERLPEPGDLHPTEGWCWVASEDCPAWHRVTVHFDAWSQWLPANALPTPEATNG